MKKKYCCKQMEYFSKLHCEDHRDIWDCPDCLVYLNNKTESYGLIIHDGGQSYITIKYCPWCGKPLT